MTPMIGVVKLYITATKTGFVSFFDDIDVNSNKFSTTVMWHNEKFMKLHVRLSEIILCVYCLEIASLRFDSTYTKA